MSERTDLLCEKMHQEKKRTWLLLHTFYSLKMFLYRQKYRLTLGRQTRKSSPPRTLYRLFDIYLALLDTAKPNIDQSRLIQNNGFCGFLFMNRLTLKLVIIPFSLV